MRYERLCYLLARILTGWLLFGFGLINALRWHDNIKLMSDQTIPYPHILLGIMVGVQIIFGFTLLLGIKQKFSAFLLLLVAIFVSIIIISYWRIIPPPTTTVQYIADKLLLFCADGGIIASLLLFIATKTPSKSIAS